MSWFVKIGDDAHNNLAEVDLGDVKPALFLGVAREHDLHWYDFYANPARFPDAAIELARSVALANEAPIDIANFPDLETMRGIIEAFNALYRWEQDTDLPKATTATDSPSTDDQTTETSSGSSEGGDGNPTARVA